MPPNLRVMYCASVSAPIIGRSSFSIPVVSDYGREGQYPTKYSDDEARLNGVRADGQYRKTGEYERFLGDESKTYREADNE